MKDWSVREPQRLIRELESIQTSFPHLRWLGTKEGRCAIEGSIFVHGQRIDMSMFYPSDFPARPPTVFLVDPSDPSKRLLPHPWHRFPDGSVCLYTKGFGARSWRREYTAAEVVHRLIEFCEVSLAGAHSPETYSEPQVMPGDMTHLRVVIPPSLAECITVPGGWGWVGLHPSPTQPVWVASAAVNANSQTSVGPVPLDSWRASALAGGIPVPWLHLGEPGKTWKERVPNLAYEMRRLAELVPEEQQVALSSAPLVLFSVGSNAAAPGAILAYTAEMLTPLGPRIATSSLVEVYDLEEAVFTRIKPLGLASPGMDNWGVVMVGLGSLGSQVAMALARSGVNHFHLFDPDVLRPENVTRHSADLTALYHPKVMVVAGQIVQVNPRAKVVPIPASPLWDSSAEGEIASHAFHRAISTPNTLVVVTTADDTVERPINEMLTLAGVPAVYASVLGTAEYGRIFRVLPRITPCYECILLAQHARPGAFRRMDPPSGGHPGNVDTYHQPGIPGMGLDVQLIANLTARMVLQTLAMSSPGVIDYPPAPGDHILFSLRGGWGFDAPLQMQLEHYPKAPGCPTCAARGEEVMSGGEWKHLRKLKQELGDLSRRLAPTAENRLLTPSQHPDALAVVLGVIGHP